MPNSKAKQLPKKAMTAFLFFFSVCRDEYKRRHPEEDFNGREIKYKCGERWKTMSLEEKKRFNQMAEDDKKRYELELHITRPVLAARATKGKLVGKDISLDTKLKKNRLKDINAPKRIVQPFMWFAKESRQKVAAANPDFSYAEITKEVARRWSELDPAEKEKYTVLHKKDKVRYAQEKKAYKKKQVKVPTEILESDDTEDES
ncbi:high mobility group protein DSP1 [Lepeophtheirus salmonis]|uniref:High mobility group protein DSP1like [Ceratitis capitata] n=1 Tax=Lepeophtheirus salmonis TaxID=72036 RepID=A0A0K2THW5_LEPSM|nr:high mobility group protein DSP1-like [Lepeophtheirus salmonis]